VFSFVNSVFCFVTSCSGFFHAEPPSRFSAPPLHPPCRCPTAAFLSARLGGLAVWVAGCISLPAGIAFS
jgi:hypothetical protein